MRQPVTGPGPHHVAERNARGYAPSRERMVGARAVEGGFRSMRCDVRLDVAPETDPRRLSMLRKQAERACVNLDTWRPGVPVELTFDIAS